MSKNIQVPYELIVNKEPTHKQMFLYIQLKNICVNNHVKIYIEKLKDYLGNNWQDTRTIKKQLIWLKENSFIDYKFDKLPKHIPIEIDVVPVKKYYIQVDIKIIKNIIQCTDNINSCKDNKVIQLKEQALKLFYYYVKLYNIEYGKAFVSYRTISKDLHISTRNIKIINSTLKENKLLKVKIGKWYIEEIDQEIFKPKRERNEYIPVMGK